MGCARNTGLVTLSTRQFAIEEVLPHVISRQTRNNTPKKKEFDGFFVNMDSLRYITFKRSGTRCCWCGLEGKFFLLQAFKDTPTGLGHFNLYGQEDNGSLVLMTRDHVIPRAKGGTDRIKNLITMCVKCNCLKADRIDVVDSDSDKDYLELTWFEQDLLIPWVNVRQILRQAGRSESCEKAVRDFLSYYDKYEGKKKKGEMELLRKWMYENGRILFEMVQFHMKMEKKASHAETEKARQD